MHENDILINENDISMHEILIHNDFEGNIFIFMHGNLFMPRFFTVFNWMQHSARYIYNQCICITRNSNCVVSRPKPPRYQPVYIVQGHLFHESLYTAFGIF